MQDIDSVPSNVQSASREALLYVFEDNEAVSKMIMKGRSPTMRHVSRTHRVALDWLFDRINLDPKIQIKYIDTKNQLADILTKGNFTRDEWNHLLTLLNISPCYLYCLHRSDGETSSTRIRRRTRLQPNHDLWWIWPQRTPSFVSSSASSNPGRTSHGYQDPERHVLDDRTGQLVENVKIKLFTKGLWSILVFSRVEKWEMGDTIDQGNLRKILGIHCKKLTLIVKTIFSAGTAHSSRYEETIHDRTGQPVSENLQGKAHFEDFIVGKWG